MNQVKRGHAAVLAGEATGQINIKISERERLAWSEMAKSQGTTLAEFVRSSVRATVTGLQK